MNKEQREKSNHQSPDEADEQFWQDFSRDLWLLFKRAENLPDAEAENLLAGETIKLSELKNTPNLRENCLTFTRCDEIGKRQNSVSAAEKTHLQDCRFCARRVERFGASPLSALPKKDDAEIEAAISPIQPPKKSLWSRLFPSAGENSRLIWSPLTFGLAGLAIILFGGLTFVVWQTNFSQSRTDVSDLKSGANETPRIPTAADFPANENSNAADFTPANSALNDSPPLPKNRREIAANENAPNARNADELAINFGAIPNDERAAVRESLRTGKISPSADLARMQNVPTRRAGEDNAATPVSPKNEATLDAAPVFRWQAAADSEYQITVTDDAGRDVAKSAILSQNSWQIEKELPAGFYFWKIAVRRKGVDEPSKNLSRAMFKVLSETEKRKLEAAKNSVKSNLASAILYARAGLLAEAERELNAELRKNPNSAKARKMLAQVSSWREK